MHRQSRAPNKNRRFEPLEERSFVGKVNLWIDWLRLSFHVSLLAAAHTVAQHDRHQPLPLLRLWLVLSLGLSPWRSHFSIRSSAFGLVFDFWFRHAQFLDIFEPERKVVHLALVELVYDLRVLGELRQRQHLAYSLTRSLAAVRIPCSSQ